MGALTHNGEVLQGLPANASQINFDKTGTDLNSTQTENAIKEVNTKVNTNAADITQLKSGLNNVAGKMITVLLEYSSADSYFPITGDTPEPVLGGQITLVGRNIRNSAIYALWYDTTVKAFRVGGTIAGDAPQDGDSLYVQYIA